MFHKNREVLKKAAAIAILLSVMVVLLSPYAIFLHYHTGKWTLTTKITHLQFYEYMLSKDPLAREKQVMVKAREFHPFDYIRNHKRALWERYRKGSVLSFKVLRSILYGGVGYILIIIGLFAQAWDDRRRRIEALLFSCLGPLVIVPFGNVLPRYFLCSMPIFLLWTAKGLENLNIFGKKIFNQFFGKSWIVGAAALILLITPTGFYSNVKRSIPLEERFPFEHKQMGLWMKANINDIETKWVFSRSRMVAFYSGAKK